MLGNARLENDVKDYGKLDWWRLDCFRYLLVVQSVGWYFNNYQLFASSNSTYYWFKFKTENSDWLGGGKSTAVMYFH